MRETPAQLHLPTELRTNILGHSKWNILRKALVKSVWYRWKREFQEKRDKKKKWMTDENLVAIKKKEIASRSKEWYRTVILNHRNMADWCATRSS